MGAEVPYDRAATVYVRNIIFKVYTAKISIFVKNKQNWGMEL